MARFRVKYSILATFVAFFLLMSKVIGQSYTFNPNKTYTISLDTNQNYYDGIEILNTGSQNLNFTWKLVSTDTLIDSYFQLCNSGYCFLNLPTTGIMPTIVSGDKGWLKLHMYTGKTIGTNKIKYSLKNGSISVDTLTFIINVIGGITGINELKNVKDLAVIYPNPSSSETTIQLNLLESSDVVVTSINPLGQCVYKEITKYNAGFNSINLDVKEYPSGIYTLMISTKNGVITKKLTVTK